MRGGPHVPVAVFAPILRELMNGSSQQAVAFWSGVPDRRIGAILRGEQEHIEFDTADRLLSGLEATHLWLDGPLAEYYLQPA